MAGRPLSQARAAAALEAIRAASDTPTDPRNSPIDYIPDLCDEALALADIGMVGAELASHWAVSEQTMNEWEKAHSDFADALRRARTRAKAWWQRQPRLAIREKDNRFPAGAWSQQVRALFPDEYGEKGHTITLDLGSLVVIQRAQPAELTGDQSGQGVKPLIEGRTVRLGHGPTVEGSAETKLSPTDTAAVHPSDGEP